MMEAALVASWLLPWALAGIAFAFGVVVGIALVVGACWYAERRMSKGFPL